MPEAFASRASPKFVFGPGALRELPAAVRELDGSAVFLVSDTGLARAGHVARARELLAGAGIRVVSYDHSHQNPTESDAEACCAIAKQHTFDCIVALGGGSSLDTAKACNFLLTNGGRMRDYHGYGKATKPMLPLIAVPTTAGTGSEGQSYALISRDDTHEKMACGDPKAKARIALLDPELIATVPRSVAIATGLDALVHALESAVCTKRNAFSALYAEGSFRHLAAALPRTIAGTPTTEDHGAMLLGSSLAGLAIENSMLGAAHATANPLTAHHHVIHGHAVARMIPHVMRFNSSVPAAAEIYAHFGQIVGAPLIDWVTALLARAELPAMPDNPDIPTLARDAAKQWTAQFNPRPLQPDDFVALYQDAFRA
ncbi:MAG TPA: iron-containing alcohol dehydrogenase [Opitutaceae bacterium]